MNLKFHMFSHLLSNRKCIKHLYCVCNESAYYRSSLSSYHMAWPWNPEVQCKRVTQEKMLLFLFCFVLFFSALNIGAGFLNQKEKKVNTWGTGVVHTAEDNAPLLQMHDNGEANGAEQAGCSDISVDPAKLLHNQSWWRGKKTSSSGSETG